MVPLPLTIRQWRFKEEDSDVRHVGPMAQDFHAAFGLGENDTTIATVDADGVALAAIQGLNQKLEGQKEALEDKDAQIRYLTRTVTALMERLEALESRLVE